MYIIYLFLIKILYIRENRRQNSKVVMSEGTEIRALLKQGVIFLKDSTLFISFGPAAITCATFILTQNPFSWPLALLVFFACLLVYSMNRITDREEDAINMPDRMQFPHRLRIFLLVISLVFYVILLMIVLQKNLLSFVIGLLPLIIGFMYSVLRLKRIFILKNILIAAAWGSSVLIVPAYYENWSWVCGLLFLFFFLLLFLNTIISDIKDIKGDSIFGIRTLPGRLGIPATKYFCYALLATVFIVLIPLVSIKWGIFLLIPYVCTIAIYTYYAQEGEHSPWWYYGFFVDGEFLILLFSSIIIVILQ